MRSQKLQPFFRKKSAKKLGGWLFFPSVVLAILSILISEFTNLGGQVGIGIASVIALILAMIISLKRLYVKYLSPIILYVFVTSIMNPMHYSQAFFVFLFV